jgi:hypothetical protein
VETSRKRQRTEVADTKRHRLYVIPKAIDEYGDTGRDDLEERDQSQEDNGATRRDGAGRSSGADQGEGSLLLENDGDRCHRLLRDTEGYPCEGCGGALDAKRCKRIREVTEHEIYPIGKKRGENT